MGDGVGGRVGHGDAPGRAWVAGGLGGEVAGQGGVDWAEPGRFPGVLGQAKEGGQGDGQVDPGHWMTRVGHLTGLAVAPAGSRAVLRRAVFRRAVFRSAVTVARAFTGLGAFTGR
jgi:hypothetical protein